MFRTTINKLKQPFPFLTLSQYIDWRSDRFWAGLSTALMIEQSRGKGLSEK